MPLDRGSGSKKEGPAFHFQERRGHHCKQPVSRILSRTVIPLGDALLRRSSNLPEGFRSTRWRKHHPYGGPTLARRAGTPRGYLGLAAHPSLFGLAPCGVYPAPDVTAGAVRSYRTFSPLPCALRRRRYLLCGTSRLEALTLRSRTLSGTLPCGVRTFLSRTTSARQRPSSPPARLVYASWWATMRFLYE